MDDNDLLNIPAFLKREIKDLEPIIEEPPPDKEESWIKLLREHQKKKEQRVARKAEIAQTKQERISRKARKKRIESNVLDAVGKNHITFGQIRAYIYDDTSDSEIKGAIRRLMKDGKLSKPSRRTYKVKL